MKPLRAGCSGWSYESWRGRFYPQKLSPARWLEAYAEEFVPGSRSLRALAAAVQECRGCPLWADATRAVFGRGPRRAQLMLVGEQPGDREDLAGAPFVGPAGRELRAALETAGIAADDAYLTNAVKHFKWRPRAVLALGATAARSVFGTGIRVTRDRGRPLESELAPVAAVTIHPSAILRLREHEERERARNGLVEDLRLVVAAMAAT